MVKDVPMALQYVQIKVKFIHCFILHHAIKTWEVMGLFHSFFFSLTEIRGQFDA
jgi:hypothetical protein